LASVAAAPTVELPTFKGRPGWEFTDISELDLAAYEPVTADEPATATPLFELPEPHDLPDGVIVTTIAKALSDHSELVASRLGSLVDDDPFVALNDAGYRHGAFVYVPRGVAVEQPISLSSIQARSGTLLNQRTLIVLEEGAQAEVWEQYLSGKDDLDGVFNTVVELIVGDNARLRYICGQALSERSWIFGAQRAEVGRDASLDWVALGFGSGEATCGWRRGLPARARRRASPARTRPRSPAHRLRHHPRTRGAEHDLRPRVPGRAPGSLDGRLEGQHHRRPRRPEDRRVPGVAQPADLKRAHADAIPGLEIQPTTSAARTPRPSRRSTPSSSSTCAPTASARTSPSAW